MQTTTRSPRAGRRATSSRRVGKPQGRPQGKGERWTRTCTTSGRESPNIAENSPPCSCGRVDRCRRWQAPTPFASLRAWSNLSKPVWSSLLMIVFSPGHPQNQHSTGVQGVDARQSRRGAIGRTRASVVRHQGSSGQARAGSLIDRDRWNYPCGLSPQGHDGRLRAGSALSRAAQDQPGPGADPPRADRIAPSEVVAIVRDQLVQLSENNTGGILPLGALEQFGGEGGADRGAQPCLRRHRGASVVAAARDRDPAHGWRGRLAAVQHLVVAGAQLAQLVAGRVGLGGAFAWTWTTLQWPLVFVLIATAFGLIYCFAFKRGTWLRVADARIGARGDPVDWRLAGVPLLRGPRRIVQPSCSRCSAGTKRHSGKRIRRITTRRPYPPQARCR